MAHVQAVEVQVGLIMTASPKPRGLAKLGLGLGGRICIGPLPSPSGLALGASGCLRSLCSYAGTYKPLAPKALCRNKSERSEGLCRLGAVGAWMWELGLDELTFDEQEHINIRGAYKYKPSEDFHYWTCRDLSNLICVRS